MVIVNYHYGSICGYDCDDLPLLSRRRPVLCSSQLNVPITFAPFPYNRSSSAAALLVSPGPADTVALLSGATPPRACTNRGGGGARVIAEAPIFEARDAHGNALPGGAAAGQMRVRVGWARGPSQAPPGALLPRITVNNEELPDPNRNATDGPVDYPEIEADEVGRFVLGPVMVVEGTGQMGERAVDGASQPFGMEFVVDFEWRPPGQDYFKSAYTVEVAVCDDEHRAREVQVRGWGGVMVGIVFVFVLMIVQVRGYWVMVGEQWGGRIV